MVRGYTNDDERNVKVLKLRVNIRIIELPCITINPDLDAARIWYFYEKVRPYCPVRWMEKACPNVKQKRSVVKKK